MPGMRRRNTLIGLATIALGASGFVASGAFQVGSRGSLGTAWIQVEGVEEAVQAATQQDGEVVEGDDDQDDEESDEESDEETDEETDTPDEESSPTQEESPTPTETSTAEPTVTATTTPTSTQTTTPTSTASATPTPTLSPIPGGTGGGPPADTTPTPTPTEMPTPTETATRTPTPDGPAETTLIQVITDPDNDGNALNTSSSLEWSGRMAGSETIQGNARGLFERFSVDNANRDAISRVGLVDESGIPRDRFAFIIANVGNPESPGRGGQPVNVTVSLFDGGTHIGETPQLNLPYRIVSNGGGVIETGQDLTEETVKLPMAHVTEVVIEVDSRTGTDDIEGIDTMRFTAEPRGGQ